MTNILIYGAALGVDAFAAVIVVLMTSDPHLPLPAWARRSLAGGVVHHARGQGRRPNAVAILAALDMRGWMGYEPLALEAGPAIDASIADEPEQEPGEPDRKQGPAPFDPSDPDDPLTAPLPADDVHETEPDLCGATA